MDFYKKNEISAHYLMVAAAYYDEVKYQIKIADNFDVGTDRWLLALLSRVLQDTVITNTELRKELLKFDKDYLMSHIEALTMNPTEEFSQYINRLNGIEIDVKIAEIKEETDSQKTTNPILYEKNMNLMKNLIAKRKAQLKQTPL